MAFAAAVPWIVSAVGTGVSAYSALRAGKNAQNEANFAASQQQEQAGTAQQNARLAFQNSQREIADLRDIRTRNLAAQQAAVAGSGITISGSAIDVMRDTTLEAEKAIALARMRGEQEAANYGQEAKSLLTSSDFTRRAGKNARKSSYWSAAGIAFDGASRAGSNYFSTLNAARA